MVFLGLLTFSYYCLKSLSKFTTFNYTYIITIEICAKAYTQSDEEFCGEKKSAINYFPGTTFYSKTKPKPNPVPSGAYN